MPGLNLIAWDNGVGLSRDLRLLKVALERAGFTVRISATGGRKPRKWVVRLKKSLPQLFRKSVGGNAQHLYDANIMLEHVQPEFLPLARRNFFIPNPEWCLWGDLARLDSIDAVLTKTAHAQAIFGGHGRVVAYIGFSSEDRCDSTVPRHRTFFHLAGRSKNKGTQRLMDLWRKHPEWPRLTVVQNPQEAKPVPHEVANIDHHLDHVDDVELRQMQNANLFHICTSETEGWGHYLVEALSVGAVTVTLDAPPMNELITTDRGVLVHHGDTGTQHLATTYFFDEKALETTVERVLAMPDAELERVGANARTWFLRNEAGFSARLKEALMPLFA